MDYKYRDSFNHWLNSFLAEIIRYHIRLNNISLVHVSKLLNENGFKVSVEGFRSALNSRNIAAHNFIYWSRIFEVLEIDLSKHDFIELYQIAKEYNKAYLIEYHSKRKKKV